MSSALVGWGKSMGSAWAIAATVSGPSPPAITTGTPAASAPPRPGASKSAWATSSLALRILEEVLDLGRRGEHVDRHDGRAGIQDAEVRDGELGHVRDQQRHLVAGCDAAFAQTGRDAARGTVELAVVRSRSPARRTVASGISFGIRLQDRSEVQIHVALLGRQTTEIGVTSDPTRPKPCAREAGGRVRALGPVRAWVMLLRRGPETARRAATCHSRRRGAEPGEARHRTSPTPIWLLLARRRDRARTGHLRLLEERAGQVSLPRRSPPWSATGRSAASTTSACWRGVEGDLRNPIDDAMRRRVLDRMIDEELLVQRALDLGLAVSIAACAAS